MFKMIDKKEITLKNYADVFSLNGPMRNMTSRPPSAFERANPTCDKYKTLLEFHL